MKKIIISITLMLLLTSFIAATDIIITQQPDTFYNLGDVIKVPMKISSAKTISSFLRTNLICNGIDTEVYKEYIVLSMGEEQESNVKIPLISGFTGNAAGSCVIKAILGEDYVLTNEFKISNIINTELTNQPTEISPGQNLVITGTAKKENGKNVEGFVDLLMTLEGKEIQASNTVRNGYFELNVSIPDNTKAGQYLIKVDVYETDIENKITNKGFVNYNLLVNQVPTNLEIAFENKEVEPSSSVKIKAILHDQTGEKISSTAKITIKDNLGTIIEEKEIPCDEYLEYPIKYNQPSAEWIVSAVSGSLSSETKFKIIELEKAEVTILNKTLIIKNIGNVPYNKTVLVKIGDSPMNIQASLGVDEEQKYILSAPDGEYQVEIMGKTQTVALTGGAIGIKKSGIMNALNFTFVWIFIIGILGFVSYMFFKKGWNQAFFGYITRKRNNKKEIPLTRNCLTTTKNKAELSLSIKGTKQNISLVCLKIKNLKEIESKEGEVEKTIQQIVTTAEDSKALTYENTDCIFFLFVPARTKTFKNEKLAIKTAEHIKRILDHGNKLFKDKISYGIGLNYGAIIGKQDENSFKFMSLGTLMNNSRKIANEAKEDILMSESMKEQSATDVKSEKSEAHEEGKTKSYKIKEVKEDNADNQKFIANFVKRLETHK